MAFFDQIMNTLEDSGLSKPFYCFVWVVFYGVLGGTCGSPGR